MNRYNPQEMRLLINESLQILQKGGNPEETAVWIRLLGMCDIMSGDVQSAEKHLNEAILTFEGSPEKEKYLYNLAASYAWLGEVRRHQCQYKEAIAYYDHAIGICKNHFLDGGIATFYTYAGQVALDSGDMENAERYLAQAVERFSKIGLLWERGVTFAYYGMLRLLQGRYDEALNHLIRADRCAEQLESSYEQGVLNRIYAWIAIKMKTSEALKRIFAVYLDQEPKVYIQKARSLLKNVYSPIDQTYLDSIEAME